MSIIATVYVPDGIVMAADSRTVVTMTPKPDANGQVTEPTLIFPMSDNAQKVFSLSKTNVGISAAGIPIINGMSISEYMHSFEVNELRPGESIEAVAQKLATFSSSEGKAAQYHIAGYNGGVQYVYSAVNGVTNRINLSADGEQQYGVVWNGDVVPINKLLRSDPPATVNFRIMTLGDAIDFAKYLVETTINYTHFEPKPQTCGGATDILVITRDSTFWYKHKIFAGHGA